ncbi:MAG: HlyD family efflux transporter periplasmic adaptor subunit [Flavobacteriales bacterium]|jgi:membrane fusion protein, multidrug efflux system|nr:HlyD family efflux transporter periplasmic adaptor subunit [Flavobacteriales bacterium]MBT4930547.1 HlyD family efflux transporter periplasmic adaptor subunit [Flavobacteriales bacterium]MBT5131822.1 HlyD family efflux transporter periplasmic adaptor subunit [Flavobacteriales bacterium]MBT6132079.1 HlyD family efflux transporter periplasmic adaptor subunit [Flavobacteriales bacterium]MBT7687070.1 HlyD family efflux transporter periplasmic adaptor subunit [Flavobacteriales bacterium]
MKAFEIRRYSVVAGIAILIGAVVLNNVLAGMKEPPKEEPPSDFVVPVKVLAVSNITETADVSINGRIISQRKFDVFTEVNGRLIPTTKEFKNGVSFSKGDVLLQMDDTDVRMNLVSSRSAFQTLLNSLLADLKIDYSNNFELWQSFILQLDPAKILSELPAVTDVKLKGFLVSRNVYNQYYAIKGQEAQLAKFTVTAPFDGVVNQASINPNTILRAGQRVGVFVDPTNYELEAGISLSLNDRISIGNTVQLHSNDVKGRWKGVVSRKSESLDPSTQNLKVYINVKGSNLFEGAYLNGVIMGQSLDSAISIPRYLIVNNNQVYVLNDDKLGLTTVDIIHENRDSMLVSGLADGIELVNQVVPGAHEGMKVQKVN